MGMFQPQNYGKDFVESFTGMGNYLTGQRKAASDLAQREKDNERQGRLDEQSSRESEAKIAASEASTRNSTLAGDKAERDARNVAIFDRGLPAVTRIASGAPPTKEDIDAHAALNVALPYNPNDVTKFHERIKDHNDLIGDMSFVKQNLTGRDGAWTVGPGDSPETDAVLARLERVITPARYKEFVNETDSEIGPAGTKYKTGGTPHAALRSSGGQLEIAMRMPVFDEAGKQIFKKDAEGKDTNVPVLVASTVGESSGGDDPVRWQSVDDLQRKSALSIEVMQSALKLNPEQLKQYQAAANQALMLNAPGGSEAWLKAQNKDPIQLAKGADLLDPVTRQVIASNPKSAEYKSRTRQDGLKDIFEESQDGGRSWSTVSSGPKFNPRPDKVDSNANQEQIRSRRDVAVRLRDAQRSHQTALKTGDPDAINDAVDMIENLNRDARELKVTPLPVPNRLFSSAENDAIKAQAVKNLEEQRGRASKVFGISPSVPAINQEIRRLKQTVKPGKVSFGDSQANSAATTPPPAGQHKGRMIQDDATGKKYRSDGSRWVEVN